MENYNGKDPLAEWCAGEMKLDIDGKALVIKPTMEHYRKLKASIKTGKTEDAELNREILKDILRTTFPNSQSVDDFMFRYEEKLQLALFAEMFGIPPDVLKKKFMEELNRLEPSLKSNDGKSS